jgi:phenylacetate-CoA ligase
MYRTAWKIYWKLKRNLRRSASEVQEESWQRFRRLVEYAYHHVPLYKKLYDRSDFHPDQLHEPADIRKIPCTDKALFQKTPLQERLADDYPVSRLIRRRTSGSTGSPLDVYYTAEDRIYRTLMHLRILFHNGMRLRDRMAHISDSRHATDERYSFQKFGFLAKDFIYAADPVEKQLQDLQAIRPAVIYSYASSMVLLAAEIEKQTTRPIQPRLVFTTGELLTEADRQRINRAFNVELKDIYGLVEMGDVAWQCAEVNGYHLNMDSFYAEVDESGSRGITSGPLVITNLHSWAMPFIRYQVGDVISLPDPLQQAGDASRCPCGCNFPRIRVIQGRADDWLYSADGRRISPLIFIIASIPGVQQYRMIQEAYDRLVVQILPGEGFRQETLKKVTEHVLQVMGSGIKVEAVPVDSLPKETSGKMRRVISKIAGG